MWRLQDYYKFYVEDQLPLPDELFQPLNGGSKFSKIDLADTYLQIELGEESKKLVVVNTHKG